MIPRNVAAIFLACIIAALPLSTLAAQPDDLPGYRIDEVDYTIDGNTLQPFLEEYLDIRKGRIFKDLGGLTRHIEDLQRKIVNNRVFAEDSSVTVEAIGTGNPVPVRIRVYVRNTVSALAVPLLKYNSTDGLSAAVRFKNFNFLGTLEPLGVNLDYYLETGAAEISTDLTLYAHLLKARWRFAASGNVAYHPGIGIKPNGSISLSSLYEYEAARHTWYLIPIASWLYERDYNRHTISGGLATGFDFKAGLDWSVSTHAYLNDRYVTSHYPYITNGAGISTSIPLADLPYFGIVYASPSAGLFGTYGLEAGRYTDAGYSAAAGLRAGRVDPLHNLRRGASASMDISWADHLLHEQASDAFDLTLNAELLAFAAPGPRIGLEFRAIAKWFATWTLLGEASDFDWSTLVRGRKQYLYGDLGAIINLQMPLNFAQGTFFLSEKLAAEIFVIPFLDAGYLRPTPGAAYSPGTHLILCPGVDVVIFPERARAFTYRLSLGYDAMDYLAKGELDLGSLEGWLGIGLHF